MEYLHNGHTHPKAVMMEDVLFDVMKEELCGLHCSCGPQAVQAGWMNAKE